MNGMIFRSFRKRNSSQKNTNTVYSEYSYSGIVPKERTLSHQYLFIYLFIYLKRMHEVQRMVATLREIFMNRLFSKTFIF